MSLALAPRATRASFPQPLARRAERMSCVAVPDALASQDASGREISAYQGRILWSATRGVAMQATL